MPHPFSRTCNFYKERKSVGFIERSQYTTHAISHMGNALILSIHIVHTYLRNLLCSLYPHKPLWHPQIVCSLIPVAPIPAILIRDVSRRCQLFGKLLFKNICVCDAKIYDWIWSLILDDDKKNQFHISISCLF